MLIHEDFVDLTTPTGVMRAHRFMPVGAAGLSGAKARPGIVLFSEIYQVTGPIRRTARQLAGQGFLVVCPEVYHEFEPLGCALNYDKEGTDKGNRYKVEKEVSAFDADAEACVRYLKQESLCDGRVGAMGICLGGHLAFRCAMLDGVSAAACLYPTDIHQGSLGLGKQDDTLSRLPELKAEMLMVWGKEDPHIPQAGRDLIHRAMLAAASDFTWHEFHAQHAFIRDEGYRYDPALAELVMGLVLELFRRKLG